jgi:hypothetical protein
MTEPSLSIPVYDIMEKDEPCAFSMVRSSMGQKGQPVGLQLRNTVWSDVMKFQGDNKVATQQSVVWVYEVSRRQQSNAASVVQYHEVSRR